MPGVAEHLTRSRLPDGRELRLPPAAVEAEQREFPLSPRYGEHTRTVLEETGFDGAEIDDLFGRGVVR
jgi:crotonobetainyl-CoA:carnitine CoA-transferase CaiB-like acyl-CoA transferase